MDTDSTCSLNECSDVKHSCGIHCPAGCLSGFLLILIWCWWALSISAYINKDFRTSKGQRDRETETDSLLGRWSSSGEENRFYWAVFRTFVWEEKVMQGVEVGLKERGLECMITLQTPQQHLWGVMTTTAYLLKYFWNRSLSIWGTAFCTGFEVSSTININWILAMSLRLNKAIMPFSEVTNNISLKKWHGLGDNVKLIKAWEINKFTLTRE